MHIVKKVKYINGYSLALTFENKDTKIVDLEYYLDKGIFLELRDLDYFKSVRVAGNTITWPNDADFCPDVLYQIGKELKKSKKTFSKRTNKRRLAS